MSTAAVIAQALRSARYPDGFTPPLAAPGTADEKRRAEWLIRHIAEAVEAEAAGQPAPGPRPDWPGESLTALARLARFAARSGARVWVELVPEDEIGDERWLVEIRGLGLPSDGCPGRYNATAEKAAADILAEIWQEESVFHALV